MTDALIRFAPARAAAPDRLQRFVPQAGRDYAARRNYDLGRDGHTGVSTLSPYLRARLITETEVLHATLGHHSPEAAEKFIQEVFWRTYWKGWLEMRPTVWHQYKSALKRALNDVQTQAGLRDRWAAAYAGQTEIECFNAWAQELVDTGYLHNHARMWFASIWIFTLRLPWELGADFFLRHLLDGDPASNTLGWRWVAGIQTPGKTYLARTSNISKFTEGRFAPKWQLAGEAVAVPGSPVPPASALPEMRRFDPAKRTALVLHDEDMSPSYLFEAGVRPVATAILCARSHLSPLEVAPHVTAFADAALGDMTDRYASRLGSVSQTAATPDELMAWIATTGADQIITPYAPVGPVADLFGAISNMPDAPDLVQLRRPYDGAAWPHASHGFFRFKKEIPALLDHMRAKMTL
ncbi:FAD-binding domain-containing protein [uncultured Tateyamaria sp.]|uniref:FAD-binding domain-containing protein n=1 Tax=uncultured Tateyamaria sp. TaxID=455651 RepID=UPI00261FD808|nr:FAD-binding domain-containing protein [uncultured Tateyamaria sp.]